MYWLRIGNDGENEAFDDLLEVGDYLNGCKVGKVNLWVGIGFITSNYHVDDLVLLYADSGRTLNSWEQGYIESRLEEIYA